jgi:hypothetical protein
MKVAMVSASIIWPYDGIPSVEIIKGGGFGYTLGYKYCDGSPLLTVTLRMKPRPRAASAPRN